MARHVSYTVQEGIALVTLDAPGEKVNILNADFLAELAQTAENLAAEQGLRGAVVESAKKGGFIAGADIHQIAGVEEAAEGSRLAREGQRTFGLWAALPFPVVAAVHGHCMGGGTEFILACDYRVAAEDAAIALPEIKLGILPGFGGTQRLPRLISIGDALDIILTGRTVRADRALKLGLVDAVAPPDSLRKRALEIVREAAADDRRLQAARKAKRGGLKNLLLERNPAGRALLFHLARKNVLKKTEGHYPAPLRALDTVRRGLPLPLEQALELEARVLGELVVTPECKNLVHVFFLSQRPKKGTGLEVPPLPIHRLAVLGAGIMGGGIAQLAASKGIPVTLKDIRQDAVEAGLEHARTLFERKYARRREGEKAMEASMKLITGTTSYEGFSKVDLVVEAVVEKMSVKQSVLREAETEMGENSIFATNTSALSVTELQSVSARPENVGGLHFFNPVDRMPLVEVIRGEMSSDRTVATLFDTALRLGKTPVLVADRPGFLVNRLLGVYLLEAALLAEAGVDWVSLDRVAKGFGLPMGPFRLIDEVGIEIVAESAITLCGGFSYLRGSDLVSRAFSEGLKGRKGGKGFYLYDGDRSSGPNPTLNERLGLDKGRGATEGDLQRILYLMVNEAGRCLEEKVAGAPEDVDTGMVFGTGFPPFRGGLCRWADGVGLAHVVDALEGWEKTEGSRFVPCDYIRERERFYL